MAGIDPIYSDVPPQHRSVFARIRHVLLPRTLFGRSLLILALPMVILQLIVAVIFFNRIWDNTSSRIAYALAGEVVYLKEQMASAHNDKERNAIAAQASRSLGMTVELNEDGRTIQTQNNDPFARYTWFSPGAIINEELNRRLNTPFDLRPYEKEKWFVIDVEYAPGKTFSVLSHERRVLSSTTYIFFLWVIGGAFVLFSVSMLFMRNQIRPILRLAVAAEKFGKGQDVVDFKPIGATEVRAAARAFLLMRDRLRRQIEQRTLMLAGVSHDLRTPLTRMKLQLALMPAGKDRDYLEQDIAEMESMVEGYLTFAKGAGDEPSAITDLATMMARITTNAGRAGYNVEAILPHNPAALNIRVRPMAIERALTNLVSNACRYGSRVRITASVDPESHDIMIAIDDNGPGIPASQREDVFKPFYRIEKSRNKKTGGVGLGLSITQDIILSHGGDITLTDSPLGGLRVLLQLPA